MRAYLHSVRTFAAISVVCATWCGQAAASTIVAPVSAFATSNFDPNRDNYSIKNTINQAGLSRKYVSGVTDFDSYLAKKPQHTSNADGNEWFSQDFSKASRNLSSHKIGKNLKSGKAAKNLSSGKNQVSVYSGKASNDQRYAVKASKAGKRSDSSVSSASFVSGNPLLSITYGFNGPIAINGIILWNDEFAGIGRTELLSSMDGTTYTLLSTITPKPSKFAPAGKVVPYLAQVFSFDLTTMLFFKLLVYDCPGPPSKQSSYRGCGIGEVAFSSAPRRPVENTPTVPIPAALPLLGSALGFFAWMGRRRKAI